MQLKRLTGSAGGDSCRPLHVVPRTGYGNFNLRPCWVGGIPMAKEGGCTANTSALYMMLTGSLLLFKKGCLRNVKEPTQPVAFRMSERYFSHAPAPATEIPSLASPA